MGKMMIPRWMRKSLTCCTSKVLVGTIRIRHPIGLLFLCLFLLRTMRGLSKQIWFRSLLQSYKTKKATSMTSKKTMKTQTCLMRKQRMMKEIRKNQKRFLLNLSLAPFSPKLPALLFNFQFSLETKRVTCWERIKSDSISALHQWVATKWRQICCILLLLK